MLPTIICIRTAITVTVFLTKHEGQREYLFEWIA